MRGTRAAISAAVLGVMAALAVAAAARPQTKANASIRHVLAGSTAAWNRGDLNGFLQSYWRSPETIFVTSAGIVRGWERIRARYRREYAGAGRGRMGVLRLSHLEIHRLGRDYALAIGQWHLTRSAAGGGSAGGYFTLTFRKTSAGWRIIVDHTS